MTATVPIVVILNVSAGSAGEEEIRKRIDSLLFSSGFKAEIHVAANGCSLTELADRAVRRGAQAVVAGGGDGTISAVASVLAGTETPLGILPVGTLNHFAKDLGLPLDLDEAIRNVIGGTVRRVDVGELNGRIFLNNSSLGIYPQIVTIRERHESGGSSRLMGFARATVEGLRRFPMLTVRLNADGKEMVRKTPFVFVGNNIYTMEGMNLGSRANLCAGVLCLSVAHRTGRVGLLRLAFAALRGRLREAHEFDLLLARNIRVDTRMARVRVALDGEICEMEPPLVYRIRPAALRVIVPNDGGRQASAR